MLSIIIALNAKLRIVPNMFTRLGRLSRFLEDVSRNFLDASEECRFVSIFQQVDTQSKHRPVWLPFQTPALLLEVRCSTPVLRLALTALL